MKMIQLQTVANGLIGFFFVFLSLVSKDYLFK